MIYLDHAATTPCRPEVVAAMTPYFTRVGGNPSSIHAVGQEARQALDAARDGVARLLGARAEEVLFTASGTEADNLALTGSWLAARGRRNHLVTVTTEHHAVLKTVEFLEALGVEATLVPVDGEGLVDPEAVRRAVRPDTFLISVMAANNEIGTLAPLAEIAAVARERGVPLHTDAVQTVGALPVDVNAPPVDLLTLSAHKFYGPKGAAALYVRRGTPLRPLIHGGSQERDRRAGTENVAAIVGMAAALGLAAAERAGEATRLSALRDRFIERVLADVPGAVLNGPPARRLPNNANLSFPGLEADMLLLNLDLEGVAVSSGSACSAGSVEPSHVLAALGLPHGRVISALRFSLGRGTTEAELAETAATLGRIVRRLRG
jgi:cysteine desulfurase